MLIVFGAINMDMVFTAGQLPQPGETVLCESYQITSGGKGANQALAAARMGVKVALAGCVGDDGPALRMLRALRRDGVMTTGVAESPSLPTGCASVIIDNKGNNQIVVAAGANSEAQADQLPDEVLHGKNVVLIQMELPPEENHKLINRAHERGARIILNLAPVITLPQDVLNKLDYLIVNELEAAQIAGKLGLTVEKDALTLARALSQQGELNCIVTIGAQGSVACSKKGTTYKVSALKIEEEDIIDTTGAGDAYCGTFAALIHNGAPLKDAMRHAAVAGSLACRKQGAQDSFAYLGDIKAHLEHLE